MHYYNEFNPEAAAMIRQMMVDGLIPHGDVDTRSITEVSPDEIKQYTQCHFFAGIAGWQFALQLANWPSDRPVWTGSAPCQPFSSAGRQKGKNDERHLFPVWLELIRECRPPTIFGEQVSSAVAHGWLDDVYQGLETEGYACGSAVLPACSVGSPHRRDRLWFVAHANSHNAERRSGEESGAGQEVRLRSGLDTSHVGYVANSSIQRLEGSKRKISKDASGRSSKCDKSCDVDDSQCQRRCSGNGQGEYANNADTSVQVGFWDNFGHVKCPDEKVRPIEPSIPLLAHGVQHRRPLLHAIGNAIVPQVAAEFIKASI